MVAALALAFPAAAAAQDLPAPAATPPGCVGLVLSGGGARGAAHIGVLKVMEREHIPVCAITGTSMGAIVGGLYAAGYNARELERVVGSIDWADMFIDDPPRRELPMDRKDEDFRHLLDLEIGFRDGRLSMPAGLVRGQKLMLLLRRLTLSTWQVQDFDDLPVRFRAIAADIITGKKVVFDDGDLAVAIRASMSVPGAFAPIKLGDHLLIDGGMAENVPVDEMRAMGVQKMVVVDISSPLLGEDGLSNPAVILDQMITALMREKTEASLATLGADDVLVLPELGDITSGDFNRSAEAIAAGERAAETMLPQLRRFAVAPQAYAAVRAGQHRRNFDPGLVAFLDVEKGQTPSATRHVAWQAEDMVGRPFDVERVERSVGRAYGDGRFDTIDYRLASRDGKAGLELVPRQKPWTAFGKFGLQLDDNFNGSSSYMISAELTFHDVNRLGGKWRNLIQLGRVSGLRTEFRQPFGDGGAFFLRPALELRSESLPLMSESLEQLAEYRVVRRGASLEAGFSPVPSWRVAASLVAGKDKGQRVIGDPAAFPTQEETYAGVRVGATFDTLDSVSFPTTGLRADVEYLSLRPWGDANVEGDVARISIDWAHSWERYHLLLGGRVASALDPGVNYQSQTFLGGFLNMSGFAERALVDRQAALARAVFYRRTGDTSRVFSMPLYIGASAEAGHVWTEWSDFDRSGAILGGSLFVGFDTPLGPLFLGYGRNNTGADSWYLTFGSLLRQLQN